MKNPKLRKCKAKKAYRADLEREDFFEIKKKIKDKVKMDLESPHLLIFHLKGKKISLTQNSLVIRNCTKKEAEKTISELTK